MAQLYTTGRTYVPAPRCSRSGRICWQRLPVCGEVRLQQKRRQRPVLLRRQLAQRWCSCAAALASSQQQQEALQQEAQETKASPLSNFLSWLVANGVEGLGTPGAKVALYEGEDGERGLLCTSEGEEVLRVPLRLALTDHPEDEESNALLYGGAPWSVRLACKLLREVQRGRDSPWHPYLQVLPALVPAPLNTFTWEDLKEVEYADMMEQVHATNWLVMDAFPQISSAAHGGASPEQLQWAMSVVHSRTFGTAAERGGVGVRLLVPAVDMLNHGGDQAARLLSDPALSTDTVKWELVPPGKSGSEGWEMVVAALRPIEAGEQLLLSYGERCNDGFFLHYGFVPPRNPHDDIVLFGSIEEALEWHYDADPPKEGADEEAISQLYAGAAAAAALQELETNGLAAAEGLTHERAKLRLVASSRADGRLVAAFSALRPEVKDHAARMIVRRCRELLDGMSPLAEDLRRLAAVAGEEQAYWIDMHQHYTQAIRAKEEEPQQASSSSGGGGGGGGSNAQQLTAGKEKVQDPTLARQMAWAYRAYKKMILWDADLSSSTARLDAG